MTLSEKLGPYRDRIRDNYLAPEGQLAPSLTAGIGISQAQRAAAQSRAADFVRDARANASRSGLIDKFLQEYGLSTAEGVTLMRLAEALLRTPDAATANALIEDKLEAGDWSAHKGKSPFPLVNFSTRALMLTAAWLDEVEAKDPLGRMAKATKDALDRLGEPVIRASVGQAMRIMGEHFVLGETIEQAMARGKRYAEDGYLFSFDMLGEAAHTAQDAEKYFEDYANAIAAIAKFSDSSKVADNPGISVKLSALHPRYEYGKKDRVLSELGASTRELALKAKAANMGFNIDAEEADRLDLSLDIVEQLMRDPALSDWEGFGVVVQAYQRRAPYVIDWLAALSRDTGRRIMIRLVKGAYWDSEIKRAQVMGLESYPVFTRKVLTDLSYLACARKLFNAADVFYPQIATHNALTAAMVREIADGCEEYELQRLHGMGEALHDRLLERGARSRIYAPVGGHKELLPYLVRRLLENGANSSFVNQLIDPDLSVDDIVTDPFIEVAELDEISNPHIRSPRDHLNGERLAAKGWDETHPPTANRMAPKSRHLAGAVTAQPMINGALRERTPTPVCNPALGQDQIGAVENATHNDVDEACNAALDHAAEWAATPALERAATLRRAADQLESDGERFMALAVFEAGKSWPDAIAEVREAVDFLRYYADQCLSLKGEPLGVTACISPWNFPLAIFLGQVSACLAAGNAVIAKPAEQTPLIAFEAVKLLHKAGVPGGALHYLPGDGESVGAPLVAHRAISGVVFTGSTPVAQAIKKSLVKNGKHDATLIAETGGINAMIIDSTALLEQAVTDVLSSAFQSAGQRCSACRVVCVQEDIADRFEEMLAGAMAELTTGDPARLSTDVGPVIDEEAQNNIQSHIDGMRSSAKLIAQSPDVVDDLKGTFIPPVAFEFAKLSDLKREVFGPVLHVVRYQADRLDALVDEINQLGFGLTLGVHTRVDETMERIAQRARIGNTYVNRNQIGAVVGVQPFGGEGLSGTGPKAGGPYYVGALQKRIRPEGSDTLRISDRPLTESEKEALNAADASYFTMDNKKLRGDLFLKLDEQVANGGSSILADGKHIYEKHFASPVELPGPTGESNTLRLRARGVVLCLGGGEENNEAIYRQIALAIAARNTVLVDRKLFGERTENARNMALYGVYFIDLSGGAPRSLLLDDRVRAVAYDGGSAGRAALEAVLAERKGAIIPLLSSQDDAWRYATERTLTINTTAAGGDVRLLSLAE